MAVAALETGGWGTDPTSPVDTLRRPRHSLANIMIDRHGDTAVVESHVLAYHEWEMASGTHDEIVGGRYIDRFERRDGAWKIADRRCVFEWSRLERCTVRFFERMPGRYTRGAHAPDDYLYTLLAAR